MISLSVLFFHPRRIQKRLWIDNVCAINNVVVVVIMRYVAKRYQQARKNCDNIYNYSYHQPFASHFWKFMLAVEEDRWQRTLVTIFKVAAAEPVTVAIISVSTPEIKQQCFRIRKSYNCVSLRRLTCNITQQLTGTWKLIFKKPRHGYILDLVMTWE